MTSSQTPSGRLAALLASPHVDGGVRVPAFLSKQAYFRVSKEAAEAAGATRIREDLATGEGFVADFPEDLTRVRGAEFFATFG